MKRYLLLAVVAVVVATLTAATLHFRKNAGLDELAQRTRAGLIHVQGGSFMAGNYKSRYLDPDGTEETRWVYEPAFVLSPHEVTLDDFYLQDRELTYADFNRFLRANDEPELETNRDYRVALPDHAAAVSWQEAEAYCAWLGELTELPLRLPTEAEWEFAARSRKFSPPWATDDGSYREEGNLPTYDYDRPEERDPPVASFAPNPMGFHDMAAGLYEWVSDRAGTDPEDAHIVKGGSNFSSILRETIPTRGVAEPLSPKLLETLADDQFARFRRRGDGPIHLAHATARCAASVSRPPSDSGFGRAPELTGINLTGPFSYIEK